MDLEHTKYTAWPKTLDVTQQIGTSLPLDNYCMCDYLSAGNKLFNLNRCNEELQIS